MAIFEPRAIIKNPASSAQLVKAEISIIKTTLERVVDDLGKKVQFKDWTPTSTSAIQTCSQFMRTEAETVIVELTPDEYPMHISVEEYDEEVTVHIGTDWKQMWLIVDLKIQAGSYRHDWN